MKNFFTFLLAFAVFFIISIVFSSFLSADVISLNSGGNKNIVLNPNEQIEGFFSCIPNTCSALGYNCGNWSNACGGTLNCGTCASGYTCTNGTCTLVPEGAAAGGGAGAAGGAGAPALNIAVDPTEININMIINTAVDQAITVTNLENATFSFNISQTNLDSLVILDKTSMSLAGHASDSFNARFVAPAQPGIYTGKILVDGVEIPVALNVKTSLLLFDSNIVVLNKDYKVPQGDELKTRVTLVPLGDKARLDVTLNYEIRDYNNNIYLTKSETLLVEDRVEFDRNFDTGMLPLGKYIIGLKLIYSNGVAPSSAHFEIVEKPPVDILGKLILWLIILILIIAILIITVLIVRYLKKKREEVKEATAENIYG